MQSSIQYFYLDILEAHHALGIMPLDGECAAGQFPAGPTWKINVVLFSIIAHNLTVNFGNDPFALNDNFLSVPFIIFGLGDGFDLILKNLSGVIKTGGFLNVRMSQINLAFITFFRPAGLLVFSMKIDAGVTARGGLDLGGKLKVFEVGLVDVADVK